MKKLRNIVYKSENLIVQLMQKSSSPCNTVVIVGNGHSVSVDDYNNITFCGPCYYPPKRVKGYGDKCAIFAIYYPKTCEGLAVAGEELAEFIKKNLQLYRKIILHGHSKCGCCFQNLAHWLDNWSKYRTHIVSVSAPLKGTPFANIEDFALKLNGFERFIYFKIFSNHKVDRDICPGSEFLNSLDLQDYEGLHREFIVSKCGKSFNLIDWVLAFIDFKTNIRGDGIIPLQSQIPDYPY